MSIGNFIICVFVASAVTKSIEGQQECRTPSGSIGYCIEFEKCSPLFKLLQQSWLSPDDANLIEKSWCAFNDMRAICCPTELQPITPPTQPHTQLPPKPIIDLSQHPNAYLLSLQVCGKRLNNKITGGNLTEPFEFPWMVMLRTMSGNQLKVACAGSLISSRYVLTVAHCLRSIQGETKIDSVVLGEHDTNTNPDCIDYVECADPIQVIAVERSIPHPNFNMATAQNDIGLVRLQRNALFSDSVMPICIPYTQESQTSDYKRVIVTGWGGTGNEDWSNVLLKATFDVISNRECSTIYDQRYFDRIQINENVLCVFGDNSNTCGGDSGDPASSVVSTSQFGPLVFQFGIASAGPRICVMNKGVPMLHTRVTSYVLWILDNMY